LVAVIAFFVLHDYPGTSRFLTEEERAFVVYRLKYQGQDPSRAQVAQAEEFKMKYVAQAFLDWQIWVNIFVYWGVSAASTLLSTPSDPSPNSSRLFALSTGSASFCRPLFELSATKVVRRSS
jgi:hypothetical protein